MARMDTQKGEGVAAPVAAPEREQPLVPILVDYFTRDGSTLMMRLLNTSPHIVVGEPYPCERKYFAYLFRWARLLDRREWPKRWDGRSFGSLTQEERTPLIGPPPWLPRDLLRPPSGEPAMSEYCFDMAWREFSHRARAQQGNRAGIRYYAEKHMDTRKLDLAELPPVKVIVLLRDPRDTYISIRAFDRKRRESGHKGPRCGPRTPSPGRSGWTGSSTGSGIGCAGSTISCAPTRSRPRDGVATRPARGEAAPGTRGGHRRPSRRPVVPGPRGYLG